jgi:hypothetical protein
VAAAFVGVSVALATRFFGARGNARLIARLSSFLFVMLALTVAAFSLSVVVSGGAILSGWSIVPPAALFAVSAALSWRFPRAFGFPVVVGLGAAGAIMGYCLFSLPPATEDAPVGSVAFARGDAVSVRFAGTAISSQQVERGADSLLPVHAEVAVVRFHKLWPFFGGMARSSLRSLRFGAGAPILSPQPLPIDYLFPTEGRSDASRTLLLGIRIDKLTGDFEPENVAVGARLGIYLREGSIRFIP